eukprot:12193854-Karenia_brevis.AAC.1
MSELPLPIVMTYDFKAAFTSLSQKNLYAVLIAMQVPTGLLQLIMSIYKAAKVTSGVIQGCPLSGTLFVLATQPILGHLHEVIDACGKGVTRACADDIGCCYKSLWHLQCVNPVFKAAERAANLVLKIKKCVIAPLSKAPTCLLYTSDAADDM